MKNSLEFINKVKDIKLQEGQLLLLFDVSSLLSFQVGHFYILESVLLEITIILSCLHLSETHSVYCIAKKLWPIQIF
jgi:hypothetical protein